MKAKLAVIVAAVLLLVGCSSISSGIITDKKYSEAYDYPVSYCAGYNSKSQCTYWSQRWEHVPESFKFDIQDGDDTGWVYVSSYVFDEYAIGDYYREKK